MIFNKKLFRESTYKILTVLFLIGYNFTPPILAANEILNLDVPVGTEIVQEIDHSEDILEEGISDPEDIAKGKEVEKPKMSLYRADVLPRALLSSSGEYSISSTSGTWTGVTPSGVASGLNTNII